MKKLVFALLLLAAVVSMTGSPARAEWWDTGCEQPPAGSDDIFLYCSCRWSECLAECGGSGPSICKTQCSWEKQLCNGGSGPWVN